MLSKVTLNHKMVELNSFFFKTIIKTHLRSKIYIIQNISSAFCVKHEITGWQIKLLIFMAHTLLRHVY